MCACQYTEEVLEMTVSLSSREEGELAAKGGVWWIELKRGELVV